MIKNFEEIITLQRGFDLPKQDRDTGEHPLVSANGISDYINKYNVSGPGVVTGRSGTIGNVFYVKNDFWPLNTTLFVKDFHGNNVKYISYWLSRFDLIKYANGASVPTLNRNELNGLKCFVHTPSEQQHIVNTIGTVDDLIEKKIQTVNKLEELSKLLYLKHKNQRDGTLMLGECCDIRTGKLDANAEEKEGKYPFFTCGQEIMRINNYAFDCEAIIIAGNGEISVKYYKGKFNAYQRTYVLSPMKHFYLFLEECKLSINDLKSNSQGSVIKFITKGMLEKIKIVNDKDASRINQKLGAFYKEILKLKQQLDSLKKIKTKLLSKYF